MKHPFLFLLSICFYYSVSAQSTIAKFKYEQAEESFAKADFVTSLSQLDEAEKILSASNPKILYLRIMAQGKLVEKDPLNDYTLLESARKNCSYYLKNYEAVSGIEDKYREVYYVSEYLNKQPKTMVEFASLKEAAAKKQQEEKKKEQEKKAHEKIELNSARIQANKKDHLAFHNRAIAKMSLEDYKGALEDIDQAISLNKITAPYFKHRGFIKQFLEDNAGAIEDYSRSIELDPKDQEAYEYRASLKDLTGDYTIAINDYTSLIALSANKPDYQAGIYFARGIDRYQMKDFNGAYDDLSKSILLDSRQLSAYYWRGKLSILHRNNKTEAEQDFQKIMQASEVNPQQAFAVYFLGNKEKAFKLFDELIKKNTNNANAFYNRAGLYSLDKNKTAAIADLKTALEKGLRDFTRIMYDENMDIIRNEPEFISLIQQYKK